MFKDLPGPAEIDRSARWPVLLLVMSSLVWLVLGLGLLLLGHLKWWIPDLWAASAPLSYGVLMPASLHLLFYGFASQAGLGLILWMLARLGRSHFRQRWLTTVGGILWNMGVALGALGIFSGDATGYYLFSAPVYGTAVMWAGWLALAVAAWLNLRSRRKNEIFPSQWWGMAGVMWFFWLLTTGMVMLQCVPPRGVMQVVVSTWIANNMVLLWLTSAGMAALLYLLPKLTERPLYSVPLTKTTFWVLATFGTTCGFHHAMPLPRWLPAISSVCDLILLTAVLAMALNLHRTVGNQYRRLGTDPALLLGSLGFVFWMTALLLQVLLSRASLREVTELTWLAVAKNQLMILGFALPVLLGGLWHLLPRLCEHPWPWASRVAALMNFTLTAGTLLWLVGLLWAGNAQAGILADPRAPFINAVAVALPGLKMAAAGLAVYFSGAVGFFLVSLALGWRALRTVMPRCCGQATAGVPSTVEAAP